MLIKKNNNVEEEKTDRYLITYADLITLLLGLFVILYAVSKIDLEKYDAYTAAFSEVFNPGSGVLPKDKGLTTGNDAGSVIQNPTLPNPKSIEDVEKEVESALGEFIDSGQIGYERTGDEIKLTLPEKLLFPSGRSEIRPAAIPVIDSIGGALQGAEFLITCDGHTDSDPINSARFESNWHLSVDRAANVARELMNTGVPERYFVVRGFAAERPKASNATEEGKAINRRVEITVGPLPTEAPSKEGLTGGDESDQTVSDSGGESQ